MLGNKIRLLLAATLVVLAGCGDDGGSSNGSAASTAPQEQLKFVQTWGTAAASATTTATLPYFPSVANQTTGITAPGVAIAPAITPPSGTSTTAAILLNTTVRQFFRVTAGGTRVRVRLTNGFSTAPLTLDEVHIARADRAACQPPLVPVPPATAARGATCSNIVAATDTALTFNSSKMVTLAAGQDVYSDPVEINVPALSYVAVSFYAKGATPAVTTHNTGVATAYYAVGTAGVTANYTGATAFDTATIGGKAALATTTTVAVVNGIDVALPANSRAIVLLGDSITDGVNVLLDTPTRWLDKLAERFETQRLADGKLAVPVSNAAINANKVGSDNANLAAGIAGVTRFQKDVLSRSGVTDVIVLEGINDIGQPAVPAPASNIIASYRDLIRQAHAANVKIYFATITPIRTDVATQAGTYGGLFSPSKALFDLREPVRQEVNAWILSTKEHDGFFDFNAAVSAPGALNQMLAQNSISLTNGTNDQLHPSAAGLAAMANAVDISLFRQ